MRAAATPCLACSTTIPSGARFCPRCGGPAAEVSDRNRAPIINLGKLPSRIPIAGILFLVALVVGPAAIVAGIVTGAHLLLYAGIAVAIGVVILLLLGLVF